MLCICIMGIPSYFSYIVKNHRNIIKKYNPLLTKVDNLYLDCNSIVYDCAREITNANNKSTFEKRLIKSVNEKILYYINIINPSGHVMIAFDGVAPVAKLEQQRNRRYKTWLEKQILESSDSNNVWNTISITPGTAFMKRLGNGVKSFFRQQKNLMLKKLIISASDESGEGEHKIYEYIRENPEYHKKTATAYMV